MVKERGCEIFETPGRIPVLSFADVSLDDCGEEGILKTIASQTVQC
jgi:hypothetical protein